MKLIQTDPNLTNSSAGPFFKLGVIDNTSLKQTKISTFTLWKKISNYTKISINRTCILFTK